MNRSKNTILNAEAAEEQRVAEKISLVSVGVYAG